MEAVEISPFDFGVGAHTRIDGGPVVFWYLPKLSLGAFSAGVGYVLAEFWKSGFQIREKSDAVMLARVAREGKGMSYDVRLARKKIRPETVDLILLEEDVHWGCYAPKVGALYLVAKGASQRRNIMRALRRYAEMGVLTSRVIRQRAIVTFMGREEFLMDLHAGLRERK